MIGIAELLIFAMASGIIVTYVLIVRRFLNHDQ